MKIKDYKCKCGNDDFFFVDKGNQKGIYCSYCGKWLIKWADKNEQNLAMKQESVLDKIRAEIAKDLSNVEKESRYTQDDIDCGICVGLKRAIDTIDKYRGESGE